MQAKWKDIGNTIDRRFYLEDSSDKKKLVEILLIVGTLLTAFKIESYYNLAFAFFVVFTIPYFVMVRKKLDKNEKDKRFLNYLSFFIAATFSVIVSSFLALNLVNNLSSPTMRVVLYLAFSLFYYMFILIVIWTALKTK